MGLPASNVMADGAYDSDALRQISIDKRATAVILSNPSRTKKYPLDKHLFARRHLVECRFSKHKSAASPLAPRKPPATPAPSPLSPPSS